MEASSSLKLSPVFLAPSAVVLTSITLLSSPAISQTAKGAASLPSITVDAPKRVARPIRPERVAPRRTSATAYMPAAQTSPATPEAIVEGPGSTMGKLARLEKLASSCNGGCETSFRTKDAPWVGCNESVGYYSVFSVTCRDTLTYGSYTGCMNTKMFTGWDRNRAWWYCTSLSAGNKFRVADLKRSR